MSIGDRAADLLTLDLFAVLGLLPTANADDVKKGYFAAVKQFHPDRAPSEELRPAFTKAFARIELAKATLTDATRRARYADELARPGTTAANARSTAEAAFEFAKAEAYLKTNDRARAEEHARKAVRLAPKNVDYAVLLVAAQVTQEAKPAKLEELLAELDRLIAVKPDAERALFQRGQVQKRLGRTTQAMADFARAAELNPSNIEAARELRIHQMRTQEKRAPEPSEKGAAGLFHRLFKR